MTRRSVIALAGLAALACTDNSRTPMEPAAANSAAAELADVSNSWIIRRDMPLARTQFAIAMLNEFDGGSTLYVIGGRSAGGELSRVQAYNVATDTWTYRASLPVPTKWPNGAGVINRKIYVAGGIAHPPGGSFYSSQLYVYTPATNTWVAKRSMPFAGFAGFSGVIDNKLYVATQCNDPEACGEGQWLLRYDPLTDRWTQLATPPLDLNLSGFIAAVISKKIYFGAPFQKRLDVYDPVTNTWSQRESNFQIRFGAAATMLGGKLYMIGGTKRNADGTFTSSLATSVYDPATNLWTNRAPLPHSVGPYAQRVFLNGRPRIEVVSQGAGNNLQYIP